MKLGYRHNYGGAVAAPAEPSEESPEIFPSLYISGPAAEKLLKKYETGDTITATVKLKVVGTRVSAHESNIELEAHSLDCEPEKEAANGEDAVDNYLKRKGK